MTKEPLLHRKELVERAREATQRRDWLEALCRWDAVRQRYPDDPWAHCQAGDALRSAGRLDEAEALLAAGIVRFPDHRHIAVAHARTAVARHDWEAALARWEAIRTRFPDVPEAYRGGAEALRELGRADAAEALFADATVRFPDHEWMAIAHAKAAAARRDWQEALRRWERVRTRFPYRVHGYTGGVEALRSLGRSQEAMTLLDEGTAALAAARSAGLDERAALQMEINLAEARNDWQTTRRAAEQLIAIENSSSAQTLLALARACWHLKVLAEAESAASRALTLEPMLAEAAIIGAWVATEQGDGEKSVYYYETLARIQPNTPRWPLELIRTLNILGRVNEVAIQLRGVVSRWPDHPLVRSNEMAHSFGALTWLDTARGGLDSADAGTAAERAFPEVAAKAPSAAELRRTVIIDNPARDVIYCKAEDATAAVFVFTAMNDAFGIPLSIFDRYLAALGVSAVYLKDFNRLLYLRGVRSLGSDYQTTVAALRGILDRLRVQELYVFGHSSGGFAAIRYGVELRACRIVCFSTATRISAELVPQFRRSRRITTKRYLASATSDMCDLKPFLQNKRHASEIRLYYADGDEFDRAEALHLEGLEGVSLHQVAGVSKHNIVLPMAACGIFRDVIASVFDFSSQAAQRQRHSQSPTMASTK